MPIFFGLACLVCHLHITFLMVCQVCRFLRLLQCCVCLLWTCPGKACKTPCTNLDKECAPYLAENEATDLMWNTLQSQAFF